MSGSDGEGRYPVGAALDVFRRYVDILGDPGEYSGMDLDALRERLNIADGELVSWLGVRSFIVGHVSKFKAEHDLPVRDLGRENDVLEGAVRNGKRCDLGEDYIREVFGAIIRRSCGDQEALREQSSED
ncbi:MAG: chorismate mutase [Candidatus Thorarchaeota archaeon]|jgi:chorismate mutase